MSENEEEGVAEEFTPEAFEALKAEKETALAELAKLREKDMNFAALRKKQLGELTEEEKEKYVGEKLEEVEKKQAEFHQSQVTERIEDALDVFAGDDKAAREKLRLNYGRISDVATSRKEIMLKMKEAAKLSDMGPVAADSFARASSHYGGPTAPKAEKRFSETERGAEFRRNVGIPDPLESARRGGFFIEPESK